MPAAPPTNLQFITHVSMMIASAIVAIEKKMPRINERLATGGFRFTPQRERVYNVLLEQRDHPGATESGA